MRFCSPLCFVAGLGCKRGQDCVDEHGECDVPVPAHVSTDLVLVQAALVLRCLEAPLDRPAAAGDALQRAGIGQADRWLFLDGVGALDEAVQGVDKEILARSGRCRRG